MVQFSFHQFDLIWHPPIHMINTNQIVLVVVLVKEIRSSVQRLNTTAGIKIQLSDV